MRCFVKVFGGVFVLGRVAAADIPADQAHTQMDPGIAELNAVLTNMFVRFSYFDLIEVSTFFWHRFLLSVGTHPLRWCRKAWATLERKDSGATLR